MGKLSVGVKGSMGSKWVLSVVGKLSLFEPFGTIAREYAFVYSCLRNYTI